MLTKGATMSTCGKYLLILTLLISLPVVAEQTGEPEDRAKEKESQQESREPAQTRGEEPARRFVPSEKLRADDAVAFPVDI